MVGGAKYQLYKSTCGSAAQELYWDQFEDQKPDQTEVQEPADVLQQKQSFNEPFSWRFPDPPPEDEPQYPPEFELKIPTAANSVSAVCGESSVRVEAKKDLLGIGKPVQAAEVTLGGCPATEEDTEAQVLIFEAELHGCGSQLQMTEDSFVYIFTLLYTPTPLGDSQILRTRDVSVSIQCHYQREHNVSSDVLKPTWTPFSIKKAAEENLYFSFRLMTDDWQFPRPSTQFFLGDMMRFEVSVKQFHHAPLRVMVDSCVATVAPSIDTVPRYAFLGNSGCLFDSQLTGSHSRFLPRSQDDRLQFELEAFRFQQDDSGVIYITCSLRATAASAAARATNKACSFSNGWREAGGRHDVCACCDSDCGTGSQSHFTGTGAQWEQETAVGPIKVEERPLQ
ncbi:zona pellucida sperm-binding protein 3-like isoform X2 [Cheilinus undulatus]|uniref:zona pellucida sperm-binding protein 3-like isoform X2 n=1 Tax=Cheilinus undulatus TaxID=241271 RepID=UPI001BD2B030|nr:zona pellucida sperm-binding protein 3-like isoform X2 [Cheilinus undulatus]